MWNSPTDPLNTHLTRPGQPTGGSSPIFPAHTDDGRINRMSA